MSKQPSQSTEKRKNGHRRRRDEGVTSSYSPNNDDDGDSGNRRHTSADAPDSSHNKMSSSSTPSHHANSTATASASANASAGVSNSSREDQWRIRHRDNNNNKNNNNNHNNSNYHRNHSHHQQHQRRYSEESVDPYRNIQSAAGDIIVEETRGGLGPQRSKNGWVLFVSGLNEEAQREDILDAFSDYGPVQSLKIHLDPSTGFCKGYVLVEFNLKSEAQDAINALHGTEFLGKTVRVNWAFVGGGGGGGTTAEANTASSMGEGGNTKKFKRR